MGRPQHQQNAAAAFLFAAAAVVVIVGSSGAAADDCSTADATHYYNCTQCNYPFTDLSDQCLRCVPFRDIDTQCATCVPNSNAACNGCNFGFLAATPATKAHAGTSCLMATDVSAGSSRTVRVARPCPAMGSVPQYVAYGDGACVAQGTGGVRFYCDVPARGQVTMVEYTNPSCTQWNNATSTLTVGVLFLATLTDYACTSLQYPFGSSIVATCNYNAAADSAAVSLVGVVAALLAAIVGARSV